MTARARARVLLGLWLGLFVLLFFPWGDFRNHAHWYKVTWAPVWSLRRVLDFIGNIAVFVPFGALVRFSLSPGSKWSVRLGVGGAVALALAAEGAQLFSHMRIPSITDVIANVSGASVGVWLARRVDRGAQL